MNIRFWPCMPSDMYTVKPVSSTEAMNKSESLH